MKTTRLLPLALTLTALALAACGGGSSGGTAGQGEDLFARDILPLLTTYCSTGGCHESGAGGVTINVASADTAYANVQGMIVRGDSASSPLVTCVTADNMPLGGLKTDSMVTQWTSVVAAWIDAGAIRYAGQTPAEELPPIHWESEEEEKAAQFFTETEKAEGEKYVILANSIQVAFVNPSNHAFVSNAMGNSPRITFRIVSNAGEPVTNLMTNSNSSDFISNLTLGNGTVVKVFTAADGTIVNGVQSGESWWAFRPKLWLNYVSNATLMTITNYWVSDSRLTAVLTVYVTWNGEDFSNDFHGSDYLSNTATRFTARGAPVVASLGNYYSTHSTTSLITNRIANLWTNLGNGYYTVDFSFLTTSAPKFISNTASGSGVVTIFARQVGDDLDAFGAPRMIPFTYTASGTSFTYKDPSSLPVANADYSVANTFRAPVPAVSAGFDLLAANTAADTRRAIVDDARCGRCHVVVQGHGRGRIGVGACLACHNPNLTDLNRRSIVNGALTKTTQDGKWEESADLKYMIHALHAGSKNVAGGTREHGYVCYDRNGNPVYFGNVVFPAQLNQCEVCHFPGTWALPYRGASPGISVRAGTAMANITVWNSANLLVSTISNNDPADDLITTSESALCSACHDGELVRVHMEQNGAAFGVSRAGVLANQAQYRYVETCSLCHEKETLRTQHRF